MFNVKYVKSIEKTLKKIDKTNRILIMSWIGKNLVETDNPRLFGKALVGDKKGLWRYRVGNYRIVAEIIDNEITILIIDICHRKEIYKNK